MGIVSSNKTISKTQINCDGTLDVTLALSASPNINADPVDIVLVLDRSGSMAGDPIDTLKEAAKAFVNIIYNSTGGTNDEIAGGSRIGIVSFAETATEDLPLSTNIVAMRNDIEALNADGLTNHEDAFTKAVNILNTQGGTNRQVILIFTDGVTTAGGSAVPITDAAKAAGVTIYAIGLGSVDVTNLEAWASDPSSAYVAVTDDLTELIKLFEQFAQNISKPGSTNIVVGEYLNPDFMITNIGTPTKGTISDETDTFFNWNIDALGVTINEAASVTFTIKHIGTTSGTKAVNTHVTFTDTEGSMVTFPSPTVYVDCGPILVTEPCPTPVTATIGSCEDSLVFMAADTALESQGRILEVDVTVKNVCPHKRVALAILVTELDEYDNEYKRGMKTLTLPAHTSSHCRDVLVQCVKFVLPEDLDESGDPTSICNARRFNVRTIAHHIDNDYTCCDRS